MATKEITRTLTASLIAALLLASAAQAVPAFSGRNPATYSFFAGPARGQIITPSGGGVPTARRLTGAYGMPTASQAYPSIPESGMLVLQARQMGLDAVVRQSVSIYSNIGSSQLRLGNYANRRNVTTNTTTPSGLNFVEGEAAGGGSGDSVALALGASSAPLLGQADVVAQPFNLNDELPPLEGPSVQQAPDTAGGSAATSAQNQAEAAPEPATFALLGLGAVMLRHMRRR